MRCPQKAMTGYVTTRYYRAPEVILLWGTSELTHYCESRGHCWAVPPHCPSTVHSAPPPRDGRDTEAPIQWPSLSLKRRRSSRVHSMCWRAQSLWRHAHGMEGRYTPALDMWSVGCILAELLTLEGNPKNKKYVIWNAILVLVRVIRASYLMTQPSLRTWWLIFHTNPSTSDTSFVPDDSSFHTYMMTSYDSINDPPNKLLPPLAI